MFLDFLIDTVHQLVSVPVEKLQKTLFLIDQILSKKKVTVKMMQQICGLLNFLGRAIVPGRAFTRRLYCYTGQSRQPHTTNEAAKQVQLQAYHHIRVNGEIKADLSMWKKFLSHPSSFSRPFMDFSKVLQANEVNFFTDSSGSAEHGCGGICEESWFTQKWEREFILQQKPSIEFLELYAVTTGILLWIRRFTNQRIVIFCDNISVVHMINNSTSNCRQCLNLIHLITLECLIQNVRVYAKYIKSKENELADALSRGQETRFWSIIERKRLTVDNNPTPLPENIWPMYKVWKTVTNSR